MRTRTTWGPGGGPRSKLNADKVRAIVAQLREGIPHHVIADAYEVSRPAITDINRGKTWAHVTGRRKCL